MTKTPHKRYNKELNSLNQFMGIFKTSLKQVYTEATLGHMNTDRYDIAIKNFKDDFPQLLSNLGRVERLNFINSQRRNQEPEGR
jgi:hypothetical protein